MFYVFTVTVVVVLVAGITNLWMMPEPARANQSHQKLPKASKSYPEPTRATQEPPRAN